MEYSGAQQLSEKPKRRFRFLRGLLNFYSVFAVLLLFLGTALILTPVLPNIWYSLNEDATDEEIDSIGSVVEAAEGQKPDDSQIADETVDYGDKEINQYGVRLPEFDSSLPNKNKIYIPKIGVDSTIFEGEDAQAQMEKGVWRTYGWGTPEDKTSIILAAHRFGYVFWSQDFRKTNSFYNLPKLKTGDKVELVWKQRKYVYEVVRSETSTKFSSLDHDLVLYTCQMFNTPVRIFRYLDRVD